MNRTLLVFSSLVCTIGSAIAPALTESGLARAQETKHDAAPTASPDPGPEPTSAAARSVSLPLPISVYQERRERLRARLGPCAAIVPSRVPGSADADIDPSFHYLTGLRAPGPVLLLAPRRVDKDILLLVPDAGASVENRADTGLDHVQTRAQLRRALGLDRVATMPAADAMSPQDEVARALRSSGCYANLRPPGRAQGPARPEPELDDQRLAAYLRAFGAHVEQRWQVLEQMRAVKDEAELEHIERAVAAAIRAHERASSGMRAGESRQDISARARESLASDPGVSPAYPVRVTSAQAQAGASAGHEAGNPSPASDLVVLDVGVFYQGYAARMARTYPVSGRFSSEEARLYDAAYQAHQRAIQALRSGISLARAEELARRVLDQADGQGIGSTVPSGGHRGAYRGAYRIRGHFVGLALHDPGDLDGPLESGMVVVIETLLESADGTARVVLADTVRVDARSRRVLGADLPGERASFEAWLARARSR